MLPLMMDLCKQCSKARSIKNKLALRERIVTIRHQLMTEAVREYQAEAAADSDVDSAADDYFDLKGFLYDCEISCFECNNSKDAKIYLVIKEYLETNYGDGSNAPGKKEDSSEKRPPAKDDTARKPPSSLAEYRLKKNRREHWNDK